MANIKIITGATGEKNVNAEDDRANNYGIYGDSGIIGNNGWTFEDKDNDLYMKLLDSMTATLADAGTARLSSGDIMVQGCHARIPYGQHVDLAIAPGTTGYYRLDCITAHYHKDELGVESVAFELVQGTPQQTAITPENIATVISNINKGNMYKGDTDVYEVFWTVYIEGTKVNDPQAVATAIAPLSLIQRVLNQTNGARNADVTNLQEIGQTATSVEGNFTNWAGLDVTEKVEALKASLLSVCGALQNLSGAESINIHL